MLTDAILGIALALSLAAALASTPTVRAELHGPTLVRPSELPMAPQASAITESAIEASAAAAFEPDQRAPWPMP